MIFIKKEYRIKKSQEIEKVIKARKSTGNNYFVIYRYNNLETVNYRCALSIGKKYGNAVMRNKIKRRIRSIIRENVSLLKKLDYVIVIKPIAINLSYEEMKEMLIKLLEKEVSR